MKNKSSFEELHDNLITLREEIFKALKLQEMIEWIDRKLKRFQK